MDADLARACGHTVIWPLIPVFNDWAYHVSVIPTEAMGCGLDGAAGTIYGHFNGDGWGACVGSEGLGDANDGDGHCLEPYLPHPGEGPLPDRRGQLVPDAELTLVDAEATRNHGVW